MDIPGDDTDRHKTILIATEAYPRAILLPSLAARPADPATIRPVVVEDTRNLQRRTGHGRRRLRRLRGLAAPPRPLARLRQQVERALDAGGHAGGDAGIA